MYSLICVNEDKEVVSVVVSESKWELRKRMQEEYEREIEDALRSGYPMDELDELSELNEEWAIVAVEDSWEYQWTIEEVNEVI